MSGAMHSRLVQTALLVEPVLFIALDVEADGPELLRRLMRLAGERAPRHHPGTVAWPATLAARAMVALLGRVAQASETAEPKAQLGHLARLHGEHWPALIEFYGSGAPERWRTGWPLGS